MPTYRQTSRVSRDASARRVSRVVARHRAARSGLTSNSDTKRRRAVFSSGHEATSPAISLPGRTPVSAPQAGLAAPDLSAARYMAFLTSRWQILSRSSGSLSLSFEARAAPRKTLLPVQYEQLALVVASVRLSRISIRFPSGLPSGYSGLSSGKSVSSICSTAYL